MSNPYQPPSTPGVAITHAQLRSMLRRGHLWRRIQIAAVVAAGLVLLMLILARWLGGIGSVQVVLSLAVDAAFLAFVVKYRR